MCWYFRLMLTGGKVVLGILGFPLVIIGAIVVGIVAIDNELVLPVDDEPR